MDKPELAPPDPIDCTTPLVYWQKDVRPLMVLYCSKPGCHVNGGIRGDFSDYDVAAEFSERIKERVVTRSMPLVGSMQGAEIKLVVCWVEQGLVNN